MIRGIIAVMAAAVGYVCITAALSQAVARKNIEFAHRLTPDNGRVAAELALSLSGVEATKADRKRADAMAQGALLQDATAVAAVVALGVNAEVRGDAALARNLFAYSQKLSRRDLQTQLWAIEQAVARGNVAGALRHYDIALRTSAVGPDLLFPVLASATADPAVRAELIKTLGTKPSWGESFIVYIAARGPDPRSAAALFIGLRHSGVTIPESARAPVINALINDGFVDEAWRYYASAHRGVDRRMSRDPSFVTVTDSPSLFDWYPINDGGMTTSIQRGEDGGVFDFSAPASVGGPLLRQMQLLTPGTYRITGHSVGIEQDARARPYWMLSCQQDGRELGRVPLPNSTESNGRFAGTFVVPIGCPEQMLVLVARSSDAISGLSGQIDRVQLEPAK